MNTYIVLLRGINVGGKNILPMKSLTEILENMGFVNVITYIQSGNVVFQTKKSSRNKIAKEISEVILDKYGFMPKVLLIEFSDLQAAVKDNPFKIEDGKALHFFFLDSEPERPDLSRLDSLKAGAEDFKLKKNIFYLYAPEGIGRSKLASNVERLLGVAATARNWNTVNKLLTMVKQI